MYISPIECDSKSSVRSPLPTDYDKSVYHPHSTTCCQCWTLSHSMSPYFYIVLFLLLCSLAWLVMHVVINFVLHPIIPSFQKYGVVMVDGYIWYDSDYCLYKEILNSAIINADPYVCRGCKVSDFQSWRVSRGNIGQGKNKLLLLEHMPGSKSANRTKKVSWYFCQRCTFIVHVFHFG